MSKSTPDGWKDMDLPGDRMPRTCAACGKKLVLSRDFLWLDTLRRLSWHFECRVGRAAA